MKNILKKTILAGIGAASLTKKKVKEMTDKLVEEGEMNESEQAEFIKDVMEEAEEKTEEFGDQVEERIQKVMDKMDVAKKSDLEDIKSKIEDLKSSDK